MRPTCANSAFGTDASIRALVRAPQHLRVFHRPARDLGFAEDFLTGNAGILLSAGLPESVANAERSEQLNARYVGDTRNVEKMHALFKGKRYAEVVAIFDKAAVAATSL